jgi:hypothetical protein
MLNRLDALARAVAGMCASLCESPHSCHAAELGRWS